MIIRIRQRENGLRLRYDLDGEGFLFQGERGGMAPVQPITLAGCDVTLTGTYRLSSPVNHVPLLGIFGAEQRTRVFEISRNGGVIGTAAKSLHGWGKSCYVIDLADGTELRCYSRRKGQFDYVAIYEDAEQIALLENYLRAVDGRHDHKLYLLDAYSRHAEVLAWFALYYAQHEVEQTGDVTFAISFSRYDGKVDPAWRETHFPEENFFGKTKPFG